MKNKFIIIETTYQNITKAKKLGKTLITKKLAACIEFFPINSLYSWQNKIENSKEILIKIKTIQSHYREIEKIILKDHDYEIPQIISIALDQGFEPYLNWIDSNLKTTPKRKK
jgi:periplasmic divalent cation tolerance protein